MEIQIKLIDRSLPETKTIFKNITIEAFKNALKNYPDQLLEIIENLEESLKPSDLESGRNDISSVFHPPGI